MSRRTPVAACVVVVAFAAAAIPGRAVACQRADFEGVVDQSAASLRELNSRNKPALQDRLRLLKDKRGWSHDQFLKEAAPFVRDERIEVYDRKSNEALARITLMGEDGSTARTPDCALLEDLRGIMRQLVETQQAKWAYIFEKIDSELGK
jgi:hypothetical protein